MDKSDKERLVSDIENQLDDFFGEDENVSHKQDTPTNAVATNPLEQLKSVVLSIDWEITDDCLAELKQSVDVLMDTYEDDRYAHTMLRMLNSLGKYIKRRKAQAHPDAIRRVMSVFKSLEQIVSAASMSEKRKKTIVAAEIRKFKQLKQQVESKRLEQTATAGNMAARQIHSDIANEIHKAVSAATAPLKEELEALKQRIVAIEAKLG